MSRRFIFPLLIFLLLLPVACRAEAGGPGAAAIAGAPVTAVASTATAMPSPTATAGATPTLTPAPSATPTVTATPSPTPTPEHPLMIEVMRRRDYPAGALVIEQALEPGDNYDRYIASYRSDGNRIYALLTVPRGARPATGWPVIVFNHGYVPPDEYRTTERYVQYVDYFARSGYIVFRSDYRGHGESEGEAGGAYSSPNYTVDVLNGLAAVVTHPDADPARVGMWGHSMGGYITLRAMVISDAIRAGVIWGGVVGPYPDLFARADATATAVATMGPAAATATAAAWGATATAAAADATPSPFGRGRWRSALVATYGSPEENPAFWASISANGYLADLSGPVQLHHAITDETVPASASALLHAQVQAAGQMSELYLYENDSHDIDNNFYTAMARSLAFFDRYVKGVASDE